MVTNLLGGIASVISFTLFLPQAIATWRNRHTPGALQVVSVGTQALILVNATIWGSYAIETRAFWVGAPGLVNAPLALATIWMIRRAKFSSRSLAAAAIRSNDIPLIASRAFASQGDPGCAHCGWGGSGAHEIRITTPPGFGSIVPCSPETARFGHPQPVSSQSVTVQASAA